jgi:sugar phosphate isomerase/epimerase
VRLAYVVSAQRTRFEAVASGRDLGGFLRRLAALRFDGAELAIRDPSEPHVGPLVEAAGELGLAVPAIGTGQAYLEEGLSLASPDAIVRERAMQRLEGHTAVAQRVGALVIVGLIHGPIPPGEDRENAAERLLGSLGRVARAARTGGVRFVIEPINRYESNWLNTVEEIMDFLARLGEDNVGVLPDTFHMNIEEADLAGALRRARDRLWHVHVADSNRWAPGAGHLDFRALVSTLTEIAYPGFLSAEVLQQPTPEDAAVQTITTLGPLVSRT